MRVFFVALSLSGSVSSALAQDMTTVPVAIAPSINQVAVPTTPPTLLSRDTPVELMATSEIRSDNALPGTIFKLRVNKPVIVDGKVIIPVGSTAFAEVVASKSSSGLGKSGTMATRLKYLQLGDVQIPLEGEATTKGSGAGSAGVAILLTGWAGFFHRGNNAKLKAGELINGFIAEDVMLDMTAWPIQRTAKQQ